MVPLMSELASFRPPDSPAYTSLAELAHTPWLNSWATTSSEATVFMPPLAVPEPSPRIIPK